MEITLEALAQFCKGCLCFGDGTNCHKHAPTALNCWKVDKNNFTATLKEV